MNEERLNMSIRKFLKEVGVTSQREIEALARKTEVSTTAKLKVRMVLTAEGTDLNHVVDASIDLI